MAQGLPRPIQGLFALLAKLVQIHYAPNMLKSGYVAILGVPNVGKSTLLNALLEEKLSIVTDKPQTTRHRILGILNRPNSQILFLDTPGIHASTKLINEIYVKTALATLDDADIVLHLVPPRLPVSKEDLEIAAKVQESKKEYLVLINKIDEVDKEKLLPLIQSIDENLKPEEVLPISAKTSDGLKKLISIIEESLPEGPAYYPRDEYTNHDLRFLTGEIVREKAMKFLHQELPYALATQVEDYQDEAKIARIKVAIYVEKDSQKGIVIGAKGSMLKNIGQRAREDIEALVGKKVYLELFVKVVDNWTKDERHLKDFGLL